MGIFLAVLALLPLATYVALRRLVPGANRGLEALAILTLFVVGLGFASPFLTTRAVGTGEAYNYSLALADATQQMRAGEIPPLVGQTEFAFNGRIHPLRTAPYLFYLGRGLDLLTGQTLSFWALQNLSLAFSLLALTQVTFLGLRWGAGVAVLPAAGIAILCGGCPALLTAAYWYDLFMTVHAIPFVALAVAAVWRQARGFSWGADLTLAAGLAGAWLAHPPVALWTSVAVGTLRLVVFLRRPGLRETGSLAVAAIAATLLAAFVLASVLTLPALATGPGDPMTAPRDAIIRNIQAAFAGSLQPVPNADNNLSNLQLGYSLWGLFALSLFALRDREPRGFRLAAAAVILALLVFVVPIPGLTTALWSVVPNLVVSLSSIWPMQRLYLVLALLIGFAAAPPLAGLLAGRKGRWALLGLVVAIVWTATQAWALLQRGLASRWNETATEQSHLGNNLDLTATSYAYLETPAWFVNGVMDPRVELRLLKASDPVTPPVPKPATASVAAGRLAWPHSPASTAIRLEPGRRYAITFKFLTATATGELQLFGKTLARHYTLPTAGPGRGFGLHPDSAHVLTVWTSANVPEDIYLRYVPAPGAPAIELADYTVQPLDPATEPVTLESWVPLRCKVISPDADSFLETCRRYLPGYEATVNGRPVTPQRSPAGQLMVPVPVGRSVVEIRYAGSPWVHRAFAVSAIAWAGVLGLLLAGGAGLTWASGLQAGQFLGDRARQHKLGTAGLLAVVLAAAVAPGFWRTWRERHATGAVRVEFRLPPAAAVIGRNEPLVVTGRTGAGDFAYVRYVDAAHVQFGVDHWGVGGALSEPVALDDTATHVLEVQFGSFYPDAPPDDARRKSMVLRLDGRELLRAPLPAHPTTNAEIRVGVNAIGGSSAGEKFSGEILRVERVAPTAP
jgi:hypothetical protein